MNAQAQSGESIVCKSVSHCVDIVDRHGPDSFDYQVLNGEFQRFGKKGKTALLNMLTSKGETDMRRAQAVLARGRTLLTPDEQRKVAATWPRGDLDTHAKIMKRLSRDIIAATVARKMNFPLRPEDFGRITKGLLDDPTPALVELLSNFDSAKTEPVFLRLLRSTDGPTLNTAYQKLYAQNQEKAFKALVATLYNLKDNQPEAALAISHTLRMGRLAGFDAVMQSEAAPKLSKSRQYYDVLKSALKAHDVLPAGYLQNMPRQAEGHSDMWLTAYWEYFRSGTSEQKLDFIRLVGGFETDTAKKILLEALSDKGDWRILQSAALPLGRMKYTPAASPLKALSDHPVAAVQISALSALDGLKTGSLKGRSKYWQKTLSQKVTYCSAEPKNFKDDAKGLPFFDLVDLEFKVGGDKRRFVSTIAPTKTGYLVDWPESAIGKKGW